MVPCGAVVCGFILIAEKSNPYFHLYNSLQGLGFTWVLMKLIPSVQLLKEKTEQH